MKNNIKYFLLSLTVALGSAYQAQSQSYADNGLLFSAPRFGATARISAMGGAQMASGGDFSSLSGNPAGLGLFTRSSFVFTPEVNSSSADATYFGTNTNNNSSKFGIGQIGVVINSPSKRSKGENLENGWLSTNFAIGYNKVNNFNQYVRYGGVNKDNSITDFFSDIAYQSIGGGAPNADNNPFEASGNYIGDFAEALKLTQYSTLDRDGKTVAYYSPSGDVNNNQSQISKRTGSQSEFNLGIGGNYANNFYIGGSLNFASFSYQEYNSFNESGNYIGNIADFAGGSYDLLYDTQKSVKGSGINLKLGMIGKLSDDLRLGVNISSPTWYTVNQTVITEMGSTLRNAAGGNAIDYPTYPGDATTSPHDFTYSLRTPYKLSAGLNYTIAQKGMISADVDFVDYSSMKISSDYVDVNSDSADDISSYYKANFNARIGGEVKVGNQFMLRAGYGYEGSPYKNVDVNVQTLSGGIGYRVNNISMDLSYSSRMYNSTESPYTISDKYVFAGDTGSGPSANIKNKFNTIALTLGINF